MQIIKDNISIFELSSWENCISPEGEKLVKAVVDLRLGTLVIGGFLHADEEEYLLDEGSNQEDLWGINLYISRYGTEDFIEFDSMINIRPNQNNKSRGVEDIGKQKVIREIINKVIYA